jgi:hypothetical protein
MSNKFKNVVHHFDSDYYGEELKKPVKMKPSGESHKELTKEKIRDIRRRRYEEKRAWN